MTSSSFQLVHDSDAITVGTWEDIVLVVVHQELTMEALAASVTANRMLRSKYPRGTGALSVAPIGVKLPTAELRQEASKSIAAVRDSVLCAAQVLPGEGFWASAVRSVMTAIEMLRPDQRPRRTFGELDEATRWMGEIMGYDLAWQMELAKVTRSLVRTSPSVAASA